MLELNLAMLEHLGAMWAHVGAMLGKDRANLTQVRAKLAQVGGKLGQVGGKRSRIWDMMVGNGGEAGQDRPKWSIMELQRAKIDQHVGQHDRQ